MIFTLPENGVQPKESEDEIERRKVKARNQAQIEIEKLFNQDERNLRKLDNDLSFEDRKEDELDNNNKLIKKALKNSIFGVFGQ